MNVKNKIVIILWHNGGRLANQLWLFISVYAYCLEKGYKLENHSFFEYSRFFNISSNNTWVDSLFFKPYNFLKKVLPLSFYSNPHSYFFRTYYKIYVKFIENTKRKNIVFALDIGSSVLQYLPPSDKPNKQIVNFDNNDCSKIYLDGWLFRNSMGIKKYHSEIIKFIEPKKILIDKIKIFIDNIKSQYKHVVGVHIRQGDYKKEFRNGELYFDELNVKMFLDQYLINFNKDKKNTCFIFFSDGSVDLTKFSGINIVKSEESEIFDLFALSKTDIIIGSDSTFGALAACIGNIPIIIFKKERIDWEYYKNKNNYFENKYLTAISFKNI